MYKKHLLSLASAYEYRILKLAETHISKNMPVKKTQQLWEAE